MRLEDVHISKAELQEFKKRNFEERMDWVEFKVRWMRENGEIS